MERNRNSGQTAHKVIVTENLMNQIGIASDEPVVCTVLNGVALLHKESMSTLEKLSLAKELLNYAYEDVLDEIKEQCGECDDCTESCPYKDMVYGTEVELGDHLLSRAGIPKNAPLYPEVRPDGSIVIRSAEGIPCLQNVPEEICIFWSDNDICWGALDALIHAEAASNGR